MKKIFKAIAITAASAALCVGVAVSAGCSTGVSGTYVGEYHYIGAHTADPYGIVVEVTVKDNIITGIKDITNSEAAKSVQTYKDVVDGKEVATETYHEFTTVSTGWGRYFEANTNPNYWLLTPGTWIGKDADKLYYADLENEGEFIEWDGKTLPAPEATNIGSYGWSNDNEDEWSNHISWLLDQYIGWSVADILELSVYTDYGYKLVTVDGEITQQLDKDSKGEPYLVSYNAELSDSGLLISGSTQGSGRLLLAVQNALSK